MNGAFQGAGAGEAASANSAVSTTTTAAPARTIFTDPFTDTKTSAAKWDFNGSWWSANAGTLQAGPVAGWNSMLAYALNSSYTDGTISFDADLTQGWGYGVMFHLSGDPVKVPVNGYAFQYDAGYGTGAFVLRKWVNGAEVNPPIAVTYPPAGFQWTGTERHIEVTTKGSQITASVDGKVVLTANDSSYPTGGVGLRLWNNPGATFRNFEVTTPDEIP